MIERSECHSVCTFLETTPEDLRVRAAPETVCRQRWRAAGLANAAAAAALIRRSMIGFVM